MATAPTEPTPRTDTEKIVNTAVEKWLLGDITPRQAIEYAMEAYAEAREAQARREIERLRISLTNVIIVYEDAISSCPAEFVSLERAHRLAAVITEAARALAPGVPAPSEGTKNGKAQSE